MAYYQSYSTISANQWLIDLSAFASANGWTIDFDGVYNTSYRRLHMHKNGPHFDLYSISTTTITVYGCTGYTSGAAPSGQPNASSSRNIAMTAGNSHWFVSTAGGLFYSINISSGAFYWGCMFAMLDKVGAWTEGYCFAVPSSTLFSATWYLNSNGYAQLFYNGAWSSNGFQAGGICGGFTNNDLAAKTPNAYNLGILPLPAQLFLINTTDPTKRHPLGSIPGVYRTNGGNIYSVADEITIGSDTYAIFPLNQATLGQTTYSDLLFKLGA